MHAASEELEAVFRAHEAHRLSSLGQQNLSPDALFYKALLHLAEGDLGVCRSIVVEMAERGPRQGLFYEVSRWWRARPDSGANAAVYASPAGFESFIQNGGNVELYRALRAELAKLYAGYPELRLLDIGIGTGFAEDGALPETVRELVALDPSAELLQEALVRLRTPGRMIRPVQEGIESFLAREPEGRWPLAVASFSLHCLPEARRAHLLTELARRVKTLVIAEFDADSFQEAWGPLRYKHLRDRYERGIAEYASIGETAAVEGFLVPMFLGQFAPGVVQQTHEQPIASWKKDCETAGFREVTVRPLAPYWWAEAFLVTARG